MGTQRGQRSNIPKDWPQDIAYLLAPSYSKKLADTAVKVLMLPRSDLPPSELPVRTTGPYSNVKITKIIDPSHPANGQYGLFACQHLPPNTLILPYLGYVHDKSDTNKASDYDLSLDRELGIGVDASKMGNEARFINDYRGIAACSNAEFRDVFADLGNGKCEKRMGVFVLSTGKSGKRAKGIAKGQEILVSYGKGFWTERQKTEE